MEIENETRYIFKGVEIHNSPSGFPDSKYFFLKGSAQFDSGIKSLGVIGVEFSIPISGKSVDKHSVQDLSSFAIELMKVTIQEKPLREWFDKQTDPS